MSQKIVLKIGVVVAALMLSSCALSDGASKQATAPELVNAACTDAGVDVEAFDSKAWENLQNSLAQASEMDERYREVYTSIISVRADYNMYGNFTNIDGIEAKLNLIQNLCSSAGAPPEAPIVEPIANSIVYCQVGDGSTIYVNASDPAELSKYWALEDVKCDGSWFAPQMDPPGNPTIWAETSDQLAAYEIVKDLYVDKDIHTLYEACVMTDLGYYGNSESLSSGQASEIEAILLLCPQHPFAEKWKSLPPM